MYAVGTIALYLENADGEPAQSFVRPEERSELTQSLWWKLGGKGPAPFRAGPLLRTRPGFTGLLLAAPTPQAYSSLVLGAGAALGETLTGPRGEATLRRVTAGPGHHGGVRFIDLTRRVTPAPLGEPVKLITRTPIAGQPDILERLRSAGQTLARAFGRPEIAPDRELPDWQILGLRLRHLPDNAGLQKGSISVWSGNPYAALILEYAVITGFGENRDRGYGHLEPAKLQGR